MSTCLCADKNNLGETNKHKSEDPGSLEMMELKV